MPDTSTITISRAYVHRWMLLALVAGAIVPAGLTAFMISFGFDPLVTIGAASSMAVLVVVLFRTWRRGLRQNIQLHPSRIVFDYLAYQQEFAFASPREWTLDKVGKNWRLTALKDGSSKHIPVTAFPHLLDEARAFYGLKP
ncbi:MAG: hypothetical protein QM776_15530 [Rhodocyclaceae bacterium]